MLNSGEIRSRNLVAGGVDGSYRAISYDLRIGTVVKPGGEIAEHYTIPPQGIVEVISEERLTLPPDIAGFAMVKTGLSNQGLLALNIGIVDPGYEGRIGSFFVNFGKRDQSLKNGDVFLRVIFHEVTGDMTTFARPVPIDDAQYVAGKRANMATNFGREFLDINRVTQNYAKEQFETYRTRILGYVAAAAFILALMTFMLNFGNLMLVQRFLQPNDMTKAELLKEALDQENKDLVGQNRALMTSMQQFDRRLKAAQSGLDVANRHLEEIDQRTRNIQPTKP